MQLSYGHFSSKPIPFSFKVRRLIAMSVISVFTGLVAGLTDVRYQAFYKP